MTDAANSKNSTNRMFPTRSTSVSFSPANSTDVRTLPSDFSPAISIADAEGFEQAPGGRIVLDGLPNTRDLGGISADGGRVVKHGLLIRSGALEHATDRDVRVLLDTFNVRSVIDLRTAEERREHPDPEDAMQGVRFYDAPVLSASTFGITRGSSAFVKAAGMVRTLRAVRKDPAGMMVEAYAGMITDPQSQRGFAQFFDDVLASEKGAVLWHCTVGKDRAGLASALLLWVLGASRDDIMADYLATNCYVGGQSQDITEALATFGLADKLQGSIQVLNSADARFLDAAFDAMERTHGSVDAYLRDALGVTDERRATLRARYLVDSSKQ